MPFRLPLLTGYSDYKIEIVVIQSLKGLAASVDSPWTNSNAINARRYQFSTVSGLSKLLIACADVFPWYGKEMILSSVRSIVLFTQSTTPAMMSGYLGIVRIALGEVEKIWDSTSLWSHTFMSKHKSNAFFDTTARCAVPMIELPLQWLYC